MKAIASGLALSLLLVGCASGPETRIVNATGADPARYSKDLGECRRYASQFELDKALTQAQTALGGAMIGGAIGVATGGLMSPSMADGMITGMSVGMVVGTVARMEQEQSNLNPTVSPRVEPILVDCMRDRGYPIVDGRQPAPRLHPASYFPAGALRTAGQAPAAATQSAQMPAQAVAPAAAAQTAPSTGVAAAPAAGRNKPRADRFARQRGCTVPVAPWEAAMGTGFETYSTDCKNGAKLYIRCERGACRELK